MDLPARLETYNFVNSDEEMKQTVTIVLKNIVGQFVQHWLLGSQISPHQEPDQIELEIERSLNTLRGVTVSSVEFDGYYFNVSLTYNGYFKEYTFGLEEL